MSATTDVNGFANFVFTSAKSLEGLNDKVLTLKLQSEDVKDYATISLNFQVASTEIDDTTLPEEEVILPIVVIPTTLKNIELTTNSKSIEIPIKVFKDISPYTQGSVKVELPLKVLSGVDVGSFESYDVPVNDQGIALFEYTSPSNLKTLIDNNDTSSSFKFYHIDNSGNKEEMRVSYNIDEDTYVSTNYFLSVSTTDNNFSMGIPNLEKTFSVVIKDVDGNLINDKDINITKIQVQTENVLVGELIDISSQLLVSSLELKHENSSSFILKSKKLSGLVPLKVEVIFTDTNNAEKTLSTIVNVRVMSGPPSAISISYVSTEQDVERAKYEENFAVSVTDEYGNKVNTQPYISLGAIVGYTVDGQEISSTETNNTQRLFYGKSEIDNANANGIIDDLADDDSNTTMFEDTTGSRSEVFRWVNAEGENTDKLVVFGEGKNYEAMGKWDIEQINSSTLALQDDYFGKNREGLYYAVGHNYYQDQCLQDGREWIGSTDSDTYQLDEEGTVVISYKYDYPLMGKDAMIWVNLNGYQPDTEKNTRIGEATKHTLRGTGLIKFPTAGYSVDANQTGFATFEIWQENTTERYRNANFGWTVKEGSSCHVISKISSNDYDARTCNNGGSSIGSSYITFLLQADEDKSCTFDIDRLLISPEF